MGVLDDAIREHLDLKRRRGADPAEIERNEREALGPVRRSHEAALSPEDAGAEAFPAEEDRGEPEPSFDDVYTQTPPNTEERPSADPDHEVPEATPGPQETVQWHIDSEFEDEPVIDPPSSSSGAHRQADEPAQRPPAQEGSAPAGEGHEDMLEETPEFLQDTPDHDRLWFEQRPPRDFDFEG